jgi:hypothetical protein
MSIPGYRFSGLTEKNNDGCSAISMTASAQSWIRHFLCKVFFLPAGKMNLNVKDGMNTRFRYPYFVKRHNRSQRHLHSNGGVVKRISDTGVSDKRVRRCYLSTPARNVVRRRLSAV